MKPAGTLAVLLTVVSMALLGAQSDPAAADRSALAYGRAGQWDVAAAQWNEAAMRTSSSATTNNERLAAGRSFVMAAIAWERAGDRRAYAAFGDAVRMFLEGGTTWDVERARIKSDVETIDTALRQVPGSPGRVPVAGTLDMLQLDLEQELSLTSFTGPRPGLETPSPQTNGSSDEPTSFLPRTLLPTEAARTEVDSVPADAAIQILKHGVFAPGTPDGPDPLGEHVDVMPQIAIEREVTVLESRAIGIAGPYREPVAPHSIESSPLDQTLARTAWRYVERNLQPNGMVSAVAGYGNATMWDVGSALAAMACAEQLRIIGRPSYLAMAGAILERLSVMPLYNDELPNREYNIATLSMLDSHSQTSAVGSGWSALDIGRLLTWMSITRSWYPELAPAVSRVVGRWRFARLVRSGELFGALREDGHESVRQEGRLGYEQHAAAAIRDWGHDAVVAGGYSHRAFATVEGVRVPHDTRPHAFLTSEPFVLASLEFGGISQEFRTMTRAIYDVQQRRSASTGRLVAVSEDSLNREPWFIYNTVWHAGHDWQSVSPSGGRHPAQASFSTKAAFAWHALYQDGYSARLAAAARELASPGGFMAGLYDDGAQNSVLNINTNAVILEALLYEARGGKPFIASQHSGATR